MSKQELIEEFCSLSLDEKFELLNTFNEIVNPMSEEIEQAWIAESERRYEAIQNGSMKTVSYEEVFGR
jgi:putative addiction module component (TIGR02574 family)